MEKNYICDGKRFASYEEVLNYCKEQGFRVTNTNTIGKKYIISVVSI